MKEGVPTSTRIVECPRDAWQAITHYIPAQKKADYLQRLIASGFRCIDAVSFVSPTRVPQMADSEEVLALLDLPDYVEVIGIVVNERGAMRAANTGKVHTLGYPYSVSDEFLKRNQNQSHAQSLQVLKEIRGIAKRDSLDVVSYISMGFGNPYGEPWSMERLIDGCEALIDIGVDAISLADTVGIASPTQISDVLTTVQERLAGMEFGVHLHARRDKAKDLILAAYKAGCRRFDAALGGLGGCPFAQDELVSNIPTEVLLAELKAVGADVPRLSIGESLLELATATSGSQWDDSSPKN